MHTLIHLMVCVFESLQLMIIMVFPEYLFFLRTKMNLLNSSLRRSCILLLGFVGASDAIAQFPGEPNDRAGQFIRLIDTLDDPNRGLCIDVQGHLQGVNLKMPLNVHTCKDGFWNYDERFSPDTFAKTNLLFMPAFNACLTAVKVEEGADLKAVQCDSASPTQQWHMDEGVITLKSAPSLCITVDNKPSRVSIGTRNHPVRHLVRPLTIEQCTEQSIYQQWQFIAPSDIPGIRYPDGNTANW
ncbi:MAG: ricin-type beta-trefoil lectin domain protein [Amphritea sp.]